MSAAAPRLRLAIFDFDGTLMDSQGHIIAGMRAAFKAAGRPEPEAAAIRRVIGLGLAPAVQGVDPTISDAEADQIGHSFISYFDEDRAAGRGEKEAPLFTGAKELLYALAPSALILAIATGKGRRGLDLALSAHDIGHCFTVTQTANDAPSKPHPGMVENCLSQTGVEAGEAVVIGDTVFDMEMARHAGVAAIGVDWGYHEGDELMAAGVKALARDFEELRRLLGEDWSALW